jgi:hypothetical protein
MSSDEKLRAKFNTGGKKMEMCKKHYFMKQKSEEDTLQMTLHTADTLISPIAGINLQLS